jgi:rhodanese-related sulfurtransferase
MVVRTEGGDAMRTTRGRLVAGSQSAVQMARVADQRGQRPDVRQLARHIERTQTAEIAQLRAAATRLGTDPDGPAGGMSSAMAAGMGSETDRSSADPGALTSYADSKEHDMDPRTVQDRRGELQILDVREDEEWAAGHIDGAVHIPLGQLPQRIGELDPQRPVITVCRSGGRAGRAADLLTSQGRRAAVMDGGMQRWAREGRSSSAADGSPETVA